MKNLKIDFLKVFGIILMIMIVGFVMIGCDNPSGGGKDKDIPIIDTPINNGDNPPADAVTYTVTFDSNGGSAVDAIPVEPGNTITLPAEPTKIGYEFSDWYTDNGTFTNQFTASTTISADITVYANWTIAKLSTAKWTEILSNIDDYLTGDGELDLSVFDLGTASSDTLNDSGVFTAAFSDTSLQTNSDKIKTIILPDAATAIASGTSLAPPFKGFTNLNTVQGDNITSLGSYAFYTLTNLESIDFQNLTTIGSSAFFHCDFEEIDLPASLITISGGAFESSSLTKVTIPANVTSIGSYAFGFCSRLTSITFESAGVPLSSSTFGYGAVTSNLTSLYAANGAGTYIRSAGSGSSDWTKQT
jgi:uncharacterized repeat protein (TIGR02543 family)